MVKMTRGGYFYHENTCTIEKIVLNLQCQERKEFGLK